MKFSEKLSKLRKQNNLSQESLAEKLGMSRQAISKWESGNSYPDMSTMINICKILNCTLEDLLDDDAIGTNNFEKNNKININKWIKDLLDFITKSYNMFWSMKFKEKLICLIEMGFIILILFLAFMFIRLLLSETILRIFNPLPYNIYSTIINVIDIIYGLFTVTLGSIITIHLFKIRYLDYFITVEDNTVNGRVVEEEIIEKKTNKNDTKKYVEKKREKIIIRDPKHTTYSFFSGLAKIAIFFIKMFLIMFLIPLIILFIGIIISATISILYTKYGTIFIGIFIALLGILLVNYIFIELIFNFIFNRITNLKKIFIIFILGLVVSGIGCGISLYEFSTFDFVNNYKYKTDTLKLKMNDNIILEDINDSKINIDNTLKDINIKVKHLDNYDCYLYSNDNENYTSYYISYIFDNENIVKDILKGVKKKQINAFDPDYIYNIESITLSEKNYEKLLQNYNAYQEKLDNLDEYNNDYDEYYE